MAVSSDQAKESAIRAYPRRLTEESAIVQSSPIRPNLWAVWNQDPQNPEATIVAYVQKDNGDIVLAQRLI